MKRTETVKEGAGFARVEFLRMLNVYPVVPTV